MHCIYPGDHVVFNGSGHFPLWHAPPQALLTAEKQPRCHLKDKVERKPFLWIEILSYRWRLVISFSSCFAGGVFIAACLLDLMPDVEESFSKVLDEIKDQYKVDLDYPVAQFVIVFGFFVILTVEQTVLHFQVLKPLVLVWFYCNPSLQEQWALDAEREPLLSHRRRPSAGSTSSYSSTQGHNNHHHHQHRGVDVVQGVSNEVHQGHDGHSHGHSHAVFNHSSLRSVMLLLALSFHSVFEVANLQV